jgi:hypothetical protein
MIKMKFFSNFLFALFICPVFSFGQLKVEDVKVDNTITGFKFAKDFDGLYVFLSNGEKDLKGNTSISTFAFLVKQKIDYANSIAYLDFQMNNEKKNGFVISNVVRKDTIIGGLKAFEMIFTEKKNGKVPQLMFSYFAFIIKDNDVVFFLSGDNNKGKFIPKFKNTFYKLKF